MPHTSPETPATLPDQLIADHECPYAERIVRLAIGSSAYQMSQLAQLHAGGNCPPTAVDGSPTKKWSDWVRATKQ